MQSLYDPLNINTREIRLLSLLPAENPADPIKCTLQTISLNTKPTYIALSYFWGAVEDEKTPIHVNDNVFQATPNLCAALKRMRYNSQPSTLWVDAVCINQSDNTEKSAQIPMMKDIYQDAAAVTVWLGERDSDSDKAMPLIFGAARLYEQDPTGGNQARQIMLYVLEQEGAFAALGSFLQRDWWNRVWVIQEVAVSQRVMMLCGDRPLSWRDFRDAFIFWAVLFKDAADTNALGAPLQHLKRVVEGTSARTVLSQHGRFNGPQYDEVEQERMDKAYGLQEMLEESWNFDSSNPRDKVYAWMGLVRGRNATITADYGATEAQVYAGLVKSIMEQTGSLRLVSFTGSALRASPPIDDLPSWAPDLRRGAIGTLAQAPWWLRPKSFKASSDLPAVGSISEDLRTLTASAVKVGKIDVLDADQNDSNDRKLGNLGDKLSRWLYVVLQRKSHLSRGTEPLHETLFRIFVSFWHDMHVSLPLDGMRLGYMAFVGYNDRVQDYIVAQHREVGRDTSTYLLRTIITPLPDGGTERTAVFGPATARLPEIIRPEAMNMNLSSSSVQVPPKPKLDDFANLRRFFELWDIDIDLNSNTCTYIRLVREFLQSANPTLPMSLDDWQEGSEGILKPLLLTNMHQFANHFAATTAGKSFFVTDSGYCGLGLSATRVGDYVCIIRGCSLPVVIRELDGEECFQVVSQCYIGGAMSGEFIKSIDPRGAEWEMLNFR